MPYEHPQYAKLRLGLEQNELLLLSYNNVNTFFTKIAFLLLIWLFIFDALALRSSGVYSLI